MLQRTPSSTRTSPPFPSTTLFRSRPQHENVDTLIGGPGMAKWNAGAVRPGLRPRPCPRFQQGNNIVGDGLINVGARGGGFAVLREFPSHVPFPFQIKPKACAPSASALRRAGPGNGAWRAGREGGGSPALHKPQGAEAGGHPRDHQGRAFAPETARPLRTGADTGPENP